MPPEIARGLAIWLTRPKTPAHTTTRLLGLIDSASGRKATLAQQAKGFGHFPVVGYVWYQDDYGAPRFKFYYALHEGTDLFANTGTPVIAAVDGRIMRLVAGGGVGHGIYLLADDGSYFYYGHLGGYARHLTVGQRVHTGQVIGYVGTSADAQGTSPHCHFEFHPTGTTATVNAKPMLDAWLQNAELTLEHKVGDIRVSDLLAPLGAAHWDTLFSMLAEPIGAPPALWAAAYDGTGSTAAFADLALASLAGAARPAGAPPAQGEDPLVQLLNAANRDQAD